MTFAILAAHCARGLHLRLPSSKSEGAGKTGCLLHPRSRVRFAQTKLHTSIQGSGNTPAFPAQWLYGLLRALPGERLFCLRRPREASLLAELNASTAASEPHDFAVRFKPHTSVAALASIASHRAFVTMANAPHLRETGGVMPLIWVRTESRIFLIREGLDRISEIRSDLPVVLFVAAPHRHCDCERSKSVRSAVGWAKRSVPTIQERAR